MKNKNNFKKFKYDCPSCRAKDKVVMKCRKCLKYCCNECSVDITCLDCYTIFVETREIEAYFTDKYKQGDLVV